MFIGMKLQLLILAVAVGFSKSGNSPKPIDPGAAYTYPENYCENFDADEKFDFIVIGGGAGGSSVARRLAEIENFKVLILEAGGDPPAVSDIPGTVSQIPYSYVWHYKTTPIKGGGCHGFKGNSCQVSFGKVLGGSTVVNTLLFVRGNKQDFDDIEELGNPGWGYKDMLHYYRKLENFKADREGQVDLQLHGFGGPITTAYFPLDPHSSPLVDAIFDAFENQNLPYNVDYNGLNQVGYTAYTGTIDQLGYRYNAAKGYLTNIPDNLKVCKNALVTKINFDGNSAAEVEFLYTKQNQTLKKKAVASKEYILSAGPFNSPAILERSGIGRQEILEKYNIKPVHILNGVGENMNNHFYNLGQAYVLGNYTTKAVENPLSLGVFGFGGFFNFTDFNNEITDTQIFYRFYDGKDKYFDNLKDEVRKQMDEAGTILIAAPTTVRGHPSGSSHISCTDPLKAPIIIETPYGDKISRDREVRNAKILRKIILSDSLKNFDVKPFILKECQKYSFNSDEEILCGAELMTRPFHHETGTASMGPTTDKYVVDARLKVHGIRNVRVVDSSVLPFVPRGNTVVPTYTVGEKAADLIKEDYGVL